MPCGDVYSKISAAALADPSSTKLNTIEQTSFRGTTLRGLLVEGCAFSKIGDVMLWGAIASFMMAGVMSLLIGLGFWHARHTSTEMHMIASEAVPAA